MKVLYLFTSYRQEVFEKAKRGEDHGNGFWGMLRLPHFGVQADFAEVEQAYPWGFAKFLRQHIDVYWIHLFVFFKFFAYDFVFTSTAFGTQFVHTILHIRRPRWVMHDFSIMGIIGEEKTLKQKIFAYMVRRCAGIVTLSLAEKEKLEERFPNLKGRIEYIPFGTSIDFFTPSSAPESRDIFAPGRDPDRDYKTLFDAAAPLNAPVVVTTRESRLKKFMPLPSFIQVKDFELKEYVEAYARAAVVVVPLDTKSGLNDAMGSSVLFEAMAMGKAIVATNTYTMSSYITNGENGLLVPEGDVDAMRHALEKLLNDPELRQRLGKNARAYAEQHLDAEMLAGKLADFFKRLASL